MRQARIVQRICITRGFRVCRLLKSGPIQPTMLAEFKRQTNGHFEFRFNGLFGENQVVQASTNLFDWFTVATFGNSNAASVFLDSAATNLNRRFYRVLTP